MASPVSDKKFTLEAEHLERLRALMREEEARVDAIGADERALEAMEQELQKSLQKLAATQPPTEQREAETGRHWPAIEAKFRDSQIVPLRPKRSWGPWLGALAAAALALFVVLPRLEQEEPAYDPQFVVKGSGLAGSADCELKLIEAPDVKESADGMGYEGPDQASFQLAVRCNQKGFFHMHGAGPEPHIIRNLPLEAGQTLGIIREGQIATFVLRGGSPWVFSSSLSAEPLAAAAELPQTELEAETHGLLWFDRITVKETEQ